MSYKIPALPSKKAYLEEIADFWEIQTILNSPNHVSKLEILKILSIADDEINAEGITSDEDELDLLLDDHLIHLNDRNKFCENNYPFVIDSNNIKIEEDESLSKSLYIFLLLVTRFKMNENTNKVVNNIDGTQLFEFICAEVAKNYFGSNSESKVFGTGTSNKFISKVEDLTCFIGEGNGFKNRNNSPAIKNDAGLDVVVIKRFSDGRINNLMGFGQCKTGTSWRNDFNKLKPDTFCTKYFVDRPVFYPIKMFFISDTLNYHFDFFDNQTDTLFFNRFRIMQHSVGIPDQILNDIEMWNKGAVENLVKLIKNK